MSSKLVCTELSLPYFQVNAMIFIPSREGNPIKSEWAIFSHGYTSHKGDCLNWATRLVEAGIPCVIFDQPGHYLGSFHEVNSFEEFKDHAHELFAVAFKRLDECMKKELGIGQYPQCLNIILGGHSLGAYTSMQALKLPVFQNLKRLHIGIGFGIGQRQSTHLFETAFYEKTLAVRRQLVSPALDPKTVFAWLKDAKTHMNISGERTHIITGEDDMVVGPGGHEAFVEILEKAGNEVSSERPKRLPHHEPGGATPHLFSFLKKHFAWP